MKERASTKEREPKTLPLKPESLMAISWFSIGISLTSSKSSISLSTISSSSPAALYVFAMDLDRGRAI